MKAELRPLSRRMLRALYRWEMIPAFPRSERRPLANLLRMCRRGDYDALGTFQGGMLIGLALLWRGKDCVLLDYLLVCQGKRGCGRGKAILAALQERYQAFPVLVAEVEAPVPGGPEEESQRRRLEFYRRCGFVSLGYEARIFGVTYAMLGLWNGSPRPERAMAGHRALYQSQLPPEMFRRFIHIPQTEGTR
ncbi:GNAT family N-acetyltransferase [Pseudoflavonifractor phocaeensis]|uniref:GNAT family N-acetyltransferase n=1 Tax=Pseudoflavonifractor phocaeensis TaxID=1870988 RepID=UPI0019597820|nr:GNAT family N-acetyltransferase [Pseudoflavonifractor phocaeensis]MBM6869488.1 GNAT family N-acetyltransferase [Pseudoflavonifractor phocaeensis]MBM6938417.1 GNAT family N-acetyltransferase [Pseudoflavonifractor phocaeensis]